MPAYDTEIVPITVTHGQLQEGLAEGHLVTPSPRRCARGRAGEVLFVALHPTGRGALSANFLDQLSAQASQAYFETAGSVTAALRTAFAVINENVAPYSSGAISGAAGTSAGSALDGLLAVVRDGDIYFAYAGATMAAVMQEGTMSQFPALEDAPSRAIGLSQNVDLRYGHILLEGATTLVLAATPDPVWKTMPAPMSRLSLRAIGERMAQQSAGAEGSLAALLIRCTPLPAASKAAAGITPPPAVPTQAPVKPRTAPASPIGAASAPPPRPAREPIAPDKSAAPKQNVSAETAEDAHLSGWDAAAAFGRSVRVTVQAAGAGLQRSLGGLLPRGMMPEGGSFSLPPNLMLGTAIAIPLIVVAIVGVIYFRKGREIAFNQLMSDARAQISAASAAPSRDAWTKALQALDHAAQYGASDDLTALRNQAAHSIDSFDGIEPLEFHAALPGGLEAGTMITALIAGDRELYALDVHQGRVIRLVLGPGGYQPDNAFICEAGVYPDIMVGPPIGIAWVPDISIGQQTVSTSRGGAIVAMDSKGVLLYCPPGGKAMAGSLRPPRTGWISPVAIEIYNGRLYVLDSGAQGLWRFDYQAQDTHFSSAPSDYFSPEEDHTILRDAIDFIVAEGEIYLLHADGRLTHCRYDPLYATGIGNSTGATLCSEMQYHDTRPSHSDGPIVADALFSQMVYNPPPEPTFFLLDAHGRGTFRFSMALNFLSRYRVTISPQDQEATAMAVGADKTLFIAIGNQIYYANVRIP
jgi:hypothetical protein